MKQEAVFSSVNCSLTDQADVLEVTVPHRILATIPFVANVLWYHGSGTIGLIGWCRHMYNTHT